MLLALACGASTTPLARAADYDLARDFSIEANPNGVWSYGSLTELGGSFQLLPAARATVMENGVGLVAWHPGQTEDEHCLYPEVKHNPNAQDAALPLGLGYHEAGRVAFCGGKHKCELGYGVVRFTAPLDGSYLFAATVEPYSKLECIGNAEFLILHNNRPWTNILVAAGHSAGITNRFALLAGETVDLVAGRGRDNKLTGSWLTVDAHVTELPPDPPATNIFDLSADFSTRGNPDGAWSYGWQSNLGGSLTLYDSARVFGSEDGVSLEAWEPGLYGQPAIGHNPTATTAHSPSGQVVLPPGTVWYDAGYAGTDRNFGTVRFTVPPGVPGFYCVDTTVSPLRDGDAQGDTDFHVLRNGNELFGQFLGPTDTARYTNVVVLSPGDHLDFVIGRGADPTDGAGSLAALKIAARVAWHSAYQPSGEMPMSINFGGEPRKEGMAAIGVSEEDNWNWYNQAWEPFGTLRDLNWVDHALSPAWLTVSNAPGYWGNATGDAMYDTYVYPWDGGNISVRLYDLPTGHYDFYCYGHGAADNQNAVFELFSQGASQGCRQTTSSAAWNSIVWREGVQYVVFRDVPVQPGAPLLLEVRPGASTYAVLNGLQIVRSGGPQPLSVPAPSGLVAWWPGQEHAWDIVGAHDGFPEHLLTFVDAQVGRGFYLSSANGSVRVPAAPALDVGRADGLSVEAWVRCDDLTSPSPILEWSDQAGPAGTRFALRTAQESDLGANYLEAVLVENGSGTAHRITTAGGAITPTQFNHVVLTYDKAAGWARLYCNGAVAAETNLGSFTPETRSDVYLGRRPSGGTGSSYRGILDEVSLYNRALTSVEVQSLFGAGSAGKQWPNPTIPHPPSVLFQPESQTSYVGDSASFWAAVDGTAPITRQWFFNGQAIPDATNDSFFHSAVAFSHAGTYALLVSNEYGTAWSSNALLTVLPPPPVFLTQPATQFVVVGQDVSLSVTVTSLVAVTYQWLFQGAPLPDATADTLHLTGLQPQQYGEYRVIAANSGGAVTSQVALLIQPIAPVIFRSPTSTNVPVGTMVRFSLIVTGTAPMACQWFFGTTAIPGATSPTLVLSNVQASAAGSYFATVSNLAGLATSQTATLGVGVRPTVTRQPQDQTVSLGGTAQFSVEATGTPPLRYAWSRNGLNLAGATNATLTLEGVQTNHLGYYRVMVSNPYGSILSSNAWLRLNSLTSGVPTVVMSAPSNGASFPLATPVVISATASDADGQVTRVQIFADATNLLAVLTNVPYAWVWSNAPAGEHSLRAVVTDNSGLSSTSGPASFTIEATAQSSFKLVPTGSVWKYLCEWAGFGSEWRAPAFDDSSWASGPAQLGYGDGDEVTTVMSSITNRPITTYFRRSFTVTNRAQLTNLVVRLLRDDGGIVYLNGQEIFRSNMPLGPVNSTNLATLTINGTGETTFYSSPVPLDLLLEGANLLAVEIHQSNLSSTDLSFDLELGADLIEAPSEASSEAQPPLLASPQRNLDGTFQFQVTPQAGTTCQLEVSTDLRTWSPLMVLSNCASGLPLVIPTSTAQPFQFYRVRPL